MMEYRQQGARLLSPGLSIKHSVMLECHCSLTPLNTSLSITILGFYQLLEAQALYHFWYLSYLLKSTLVLALAVAAVFDCVGDQ
jgi:hypothetical protein